MGLKVCIGHNCWGGGYLAIVGIMDHQKTCEIKHQVITYTITRYFESFVLKTQLETCKSRCLIHNIARRDYRTLVYTSEFHKEKNLFRLYTNYNGQPLYSVGHLSYFSP